MFAALSAENRIWSAAARLQISDSFLADFSGVPQSKLTAARQQRKALEEQTAAVLLDSISRLESLTEAFRPAPLALKNAAAIRHLFEQMQGNGVTYDQISEAVKSLFQ
jgi:pectin methylesterase-like acyl-CoA thioesterase